MFIVQDTTHPGRLQRPHSETSCTECVQPDRPKLYVQPKGNPLPDVQPGHGRDMVGGNLPVAATTENYGGQTGRIFPGGEGGDDKIYEKQPES